MQVGLQFDLKLASTTTEEACPVLESMLSASSSIVAVRVYKDLPVNGKGLHELVLLTYHQCVGR